MADKCRFEGETVRHFNAGKLAVFELRAPNHRKDEIQVNIISKNFLIKVQKKVFKFLKEFKDFLSVCET